MFYVLNPTPFQGGRPNRCCRERVPQLRPGLAGARPTVWGLRLPALAARPGRSLTGVAPLPRRSCCLRPARSPPSCPPQGLPPLLTLLSAASSASGRTRWSRQPPCAGQRAQTSRLSAQQKPLSSRACSGQARPSPGSGRAPPAAASCAMAGPERAAGSGPAGTCWGAGGGRAGHAPPGQGRAEPPGAWQSTRGRQRALGSAI